MVQYFYRVPFQWEPQSVYWKPSETKAFNGKSHK
jgi:hypothetical protein